MFIQASARFLRVSFRTGPRDGLAVYHIVVNALYTLGGQQPAFWIGRHPLENLLDLLPLLVVLLHLNTQHEGGLARTGRESVRFAAKSLSFTHIN
ncbi:hypothetical protein ASG81_21855 [Paenibacillus sp. Soil522]|nr:hypothetical protein ASG81_21855 [Paenibacillus sp. Soil522]